MDINKKFSVYYTVFDIIGYDNVYLLAIKLCYLRSPVSCRVAERLVKLDCVAWVAYLKSSWQISGDRRKDNERVSRVRCRASRKGQSQLSSHHAAAWSVVRARRISCRRWVRPTIDQFHFEPLIRNFTKSSLFGGIVKIC